MNLEATYRVKVSQEEKNKYRIDTCMQNLENGRDGLICKTEMEMQTLRANMNTKREGVGELGDWCWHI